MKLKGRKYPYYFEGEIKPNDSEIVESGVREIVRTVKKYLKKNLLNEQVFFWTNFTISIF